MSAITDRIEQAIAVIVAEELIKDRGRRVSDTTVAMTVAESAEGLDAERVVDLAVAFVKHAEVGVHVPVWKFNDDGTLKDEDTLKAEQVW